MLCAVLLGPVRAISYLLSHGLTAAALAQCISRKTGFAKSLLTVAAYNAVAVVASVTLTSLTIGVNVPAFIVSNMGMMLDKLGRVLGTTATSAANNELLFIVCATGAMLHSALPLWCLPHRLCSQVCIACKFQVLYRVMPVALPGRTCSRAVMKQTFWSHLCQALMQ
jgi:Predicted membrane protein (DUF2232)